ncbi:hypothetical protein E3P99_02638 [Wallemia hederae]|uniref:PITH domain-containing protein n=1 Tax=Wallemia hederae TaxID=1540922 RepID=A0A4T0FNI6_9BASI|nr:hypothetical protein E3P99_02638 [Wallemia hederae]
MTCSDSCSDPNHTHDPHPDSGVDNGYLYGVVDLEKVTALNSDESERASSVIKTWEERNDVAVSLHSDADEQLLLRVPFTAAVKLKSVLIKGGTAEKCPRTLHLYANQSYDFADIENEPTPTQTIELVGNDSTGECIEYPVKIAKFSSCSHITLFFADNYGDDVTQLFFAGFKGSWTPLKADPVITTYEAFANPADHNKIAGTERGMSNLGS